MKILLVNKYIYRKGGSETYTLELGRTLSSQGHQVYYWGLDDNNNGEVEVIMPLKISGLTEPGNIISKLKLFFSSVYSFNAKKNVEKIIREIKPDIVHLNNFHGQFSVSIIDGIKKYGIPIALTVHDYRIICPRSILYNNNTDEICMKCKGSKFFNSVKTKCIKNSYIHSLRGFMEAFVSYKLLSAYKKIDKYIFVSKFQKDKFLEMGFDKVNYKVLPNFVSDNFLSKGQNIKKKNYGLYFGSYTKEKGVITIINAYKEMPDYELFMVGDGDCIDFSRLPNNIHNLGFKKGEEILSIVSQAKFVIVGSEIFESFGLTTIEALSCGTPVVGSDCGATPEIIEDNVNGLIFKSGNVDDLISKIRLINSDASLCLKLSKNALKSAQKYNTKNYYDQIIGIYKDCISDEKK